MQTRSYVEILKDVHLFRDFGDDTLFELSRRLVVKRWHSGAIILAAGEPSDALHIVYRGQAKSVLFGENGREMTIDVLNRADYFGENCAFANRNSSVNLLAVDDCITLMLDREVFIKHLKQRPSMMLNLASELTERVNRNNRLIGSLALEDVNTRLIKTLITIARQEGEIREDGLMIRYRPTQQDLANMVGTCRETVSRSLSSLAKKNLIVTRGRSLLLTHTLVDMRRQAA